MLHVLHACCAPVHSYRFEISAMHFNTKNLKDQTDHEPSESVLCTKQ